MMANELSSRTNTPWNFRTGNFTPIFFAMTRTGAGLGVGATWATTFFNVGGAATVGEEEASCSGQMNNVITPSKTHMGPQ
jgi:hypothetical protein